MRKPRSPLFRKITSSLIRLRSYTDLLGIVGGPLLLIRNRRRGNVLNVSIKGFQHPVAIRSRTTDINTLFKVFGEKEYHFRIAKDPKVIIDAGANIGLASICFAHQYPGAHIHAIEPENSNFDLLSHNSRFYPNIHPHRAALWHENTKVEVFNPDDKYESLSTTDSFQVRPSNALNSSSPVNTTAGSIAKSPELVDAMPLREFMKKENIEYIDILKMDIEGAEKEVLDHADDWVDRVGVMILEIHDWLKPGCLESLQRVRSRFAHEKRLGENILLATSEYWAME